MIFYECVGGAARTGRTRGCGLCGDGNCEIRKNLKALGEVGALPLLFLRFILHLDLYIQVSWGHVACFNNTGARLGCVQTGSQHRTRRAAQG